MFGRMMNNYYYGKSGKGDFKKEDLPRTRWQLFWEMLRVRLAGLCRLNLMTVAAWLPMIIVLASLITNIISVVNVEAQYQTYLTDGALTESFTEESLKAIENLGVTDAASMSALSAQAVADLMMRTLLWLIPCIAITGPVQAGLAYVTRNWSRDEHAFIWADFKDAVKENWKQGLGVSLITSVLPLVIYVGYRFYGEQALTSVAFMVPQMLILMVGVVWALALTFMYPMMVSYKVSFRQLIKNSVIMAVGRLPQTVGIRLLLLVPCALGIAAFVLTGSPIALLVLGGYYLLFGYAFARFVCASYTNGVFDRYINSHMEGVQVNRGLASDEDEEDEEEAPAEETDKEAD
ncbi:MAG: YesL family protein, partial [Clostridia bacterium]|nr:YesL family protein [Clostridia bacterium]